LYGCVCHPLINGYDDDDDDNDDGHQVSGHWQHSTVYIVMSLLLRLLLL